MKSKYLKSVSFIFKGLLGYIAFYVIWPTSLSPILHKLRGVNIRTPRKVYIAPNVLIDSIYPEYITIEDGVYLTRGVVILSHFNPTEALSSYIGRSTIVKPTTIKRGAFIGVNSIINAGVTVGMNSIVAAGSVVVKEVPDYSIVGGNPATIIGDVRTHKWQD
jgi:acetyltransferase-like isoleucine patch superfamily enzyme